MLREEELVAQLNELLGMEHKLSHWQFGQVHRYELKAMVDRIYISGEQLGEYRGQLH